MGVLRLFLALSVVAAHAQSSVLGLPAANANVAVQCFFMISGFYMALVLNGKYRDLPIRTFYLSRVLRLYPVYLLGTAVALLITAGTVAQTFGELRSWGPLYFLVSNSLIVGQDLSYLLCVPTTSGCGDPYAISINPPAWSLSVELGFYAIAPFVVRSPRRTFWFIALGLGFLAAVNLMSPTAFGHGVVVPHLSLQDPFVLRYYFYPSSFLFFGLGALAQQLSSKQATLRYWPLIALAAAATFAHTPIETWQAFVFAAAIPVVFRATARNRWDRRIGELSYPVYILHFPVLDALRTFAPPSSWVVDPAWIGSVTGIICIAVGWVVHITLEGAVTRFRSSLVDRSRPRRNPESVPMPELEPTNDEGAFPVALPGPRAPRGALFGAAVTVGYLVAPVILVAWIFVHQSGAGTS